MQLLDKKRDGFLFELLAACIIGVMYCANRNFNLFDGVLPYEFLKNYFNDMCGGALFPVYVNLLCIALNCKCRIDSFIKIAVLELACSVSWEIIAPIVLEWSVADRWDVVAYFAGGIVYLLMRIRFVGQEIKRV